MTCNKQFVSVIEALECPDVEIQRIVSTQGASNCEINAQEKNIGIRSSIHFSLLYFIMKTRYMQQWSFFVTNVTRTQMFIICKIK